LGASERVAFDAFELRINDQHLIRLTDRDGHGGFTDFPAKLPWSRKPHAALSHQRFGEAFERSSLGDAGSPRLQIGLGIEPGRECRIDFGGPRRSGKGGN
jgi:hypothetical protein